MAEDGRLQTLEDQDESPSEGKEGDRDDHDNSIHWTVLPDPFQTQ
jgi:hypothetical protein